MACPRCSGREIERSRSSEKAWKATKISAGDVVLKPDQTTLLNEIKDEWDKAEQNIKQAEMVEGDLCLPAVNELRYAGRRLVDAWIALTGGDEKEAQAKINDAKFDCYRARHDSIDAICSKVAKDLAIIVDTFGVGVVINAYADYPKLVGKLFAAQEKIEASRADRTNRSEIYSTIEAVDISSLIESYREIRLAENVMVRLFEESKAEQRDRSIYTHGGFWIGVAGVVIGVVGVVLAVVK